MESITAYTVSVIITLVILFIAAIIANLIKFEGGSKPKDPKIRKLWFWILCLVNPVLIFLLGFFVFMPDGNVRVVKNYIAALSIGTVAGFFLYILLGFILSRLFTNGKLGHWF
ncbi:hypothetical protein [Chitinophaga silvisoli]|uniref:Uncharacterized protein n=1 Tax=Chitinophaga silvisoli TaxID=2291814 RepID=A0A3E1P4P8_9BACT|nr:hypothetical protein [Chitinophaga silvisoli]RFM35173.1 hypothetical protein DXN04_07205 [Chitinophaga silvisoli]